MGQQPCDPPAPARGRGADLKEGDAVQIAAAGTGRLEVSRDRRREEALARIKSMWVALPPGYKFDRDEANERGGFRIDLDEPDDR